MKVQSKKINFIDRRGTITDIFTNDKKDHCSIIFSKKGAVRGNHYHKKTTQYTFVVSGKLLVLSKSLRGKKITKNILKPNHLVTHRPNEIHTLVALQDTTFLAFADGVRGGKNYEKDTYRIEEPLLA
jgi:dTDP-4-dehydrorhamnose 3,5-epimerase-like enzyme